ncbi:pyrroline-5-carboxylate reductase [Rhodoferax saidenbachensis]|uniref:Pyrroline-5-carboxylate reductase n=1 Tax=Rhodoferax saidenbachensis TaxID=1484693 RepID=A0A1P8KEA2_9BURK|nr:pyrroline-5-carboxylate reductase [Rhodoferax saidenbachensis]APW44296.1 pyrroline-5-carboxylate reductase [Rhodoferax saidenbachensis]
MSEHIAFIGGGNMASAIISGLIRQGFASQHMDVVEPFPEAREKLKSHFGIEAHAQAGDFLGRATIVLWAVKPQTFKEAALQVRFHTKDALHLSVAAGIRSDSIAHWLGNERVIRTMPNTPALIGKGITALYPRPAVTEKDRQLAERIVSTTGEFLWLDAESQLDAVTAISGSGPAYMFYFMEAMTAAGAEMGLPREQAYKLAVATFIGAGELARASSEPPEILRQRVTSKGGTTYAAITSMDESQIKPLFAKALHAARKRATELGDEFGES